MSSNKNFYAAVIIISSTVTAMQILQSRIFSVTTWYHLSFIVISIAMFGLTLGALHVYRGNEAEQRHNFAKLAAKSALLCGVSLYAALFVQLRIPLAFENFYFTMLSLPFVGFITGMPYYFAGITLSLCLTRTNLPVSKVYGFDLLGAAAGCLIALVIMKMVDTPSGLILLASFAAGAAILFAGLYKEPRDIIAQASKVFCVLSLIAVGINASMKHSLLSPLWVKNHYLPGDTFDFDEWNPISRITVTKEETNKAPYLWGPSPEMPANITVNYKSLQIDGDAGTIITPFDGKSWDKLSYLDYDISNLAYHLPNLHHSAIIGVGGGRDLLSAKYYGIGDVTAIDINNVQIRLLASDPVFRAYSNLYDQPGVTFVNSEARSWFRDNQQKFDLIQMSLIDTWAATGAGAFALSENGLYTVEAWSTFFKSLAPDGVFTVSRWYSPGNSGEATRQISLAVATLLHAGVKNPADHIFMAGVGRIATILLSRAPLTEEKLSILEKQAALKKFSILATPRRNGNAPEMLPFLEARDMQELNIAVEKITDFDMSPPTDMRPFFFNQVRFSQPFDMARLAFEGNPGIFSGQAKATFNLTVMIAIAALMTLGVIVLPLSRDVRHATPRFVAFGSAYFVLIGLGFMLIEISLLQGFGVFLGHPVYGLCIVLFSLILSTGLGSLLSGKLQLETRKTQALWCGLVFVCLSTLSMYLNDIFDAFGTVPLGGRAALCVLVLVPVGILLGYGFPTGMRLTHAINSRSTAWFWGINGAAGVLGSALAIAFNISFGIDRTILAASVCYALLFPLMRALDSMDRKEAA